MEKKDDTNNKNLDDLSDIKNINNKKKPSRLKIIKCVGVKSNHKQCKQLPLSDCLYCVRHAYFNKFSKDQIKSINDNDKKMRICEKCKHWHSNIDSRSCEICIQKQKDNTKAKNDNKIRCDGIFGNKKNVTNLD
jgi:hypothetical protein